MTKIYRVSGIADDPNRKLFTLMGRDPAEISVGELDLLIARDKMVTNRNIVRKRRGIGSEKSEKYNNSIDVLDDALHGLGTSDPEHYMAMIEDDILNGVFSNHGEVTGIGCVDTIATIRANKTARRRAERARRMTAESVSGIGAKKKAAAPKTQTGKFLKKVAKAHNPIVQVKTAGKLIKKVVSNPALKNVVKKVAKTAIKLSPTALTAKAILEITLPKAAPFFLYLFISDPKVVAKLPAKVKRKRDKQVKIKNFIVNVLGMKESHFMGILRNGIVKQMGASPETVLSRSLKGISGIGTIDDVGFVATTAAVALKAAPVVIEIIKKLVSVFKKNKPDGLDPNSDDAPSENDFAGLDTSDVTKLSSLIKQQNDTPTADPEPLTKEETAQLPPVRKSDIDNEEKQGKDDGGKPQGTKVFAPEGTTEAAAEASGKERIDVDDQGEIQKSAGNAKDFETGGRKEWNSFGNK